MKKIVCLALAAITLNCSYAQQKLNGGGMSYIGMPKPNIIIYHDSAFLGARQFLPLFQRYNDPELNMLVQKHQSNKVTGQVIGFIGAVCIAVGVAEVTMTNPNRSLGWSLVGGGFAASLFGGYLTVMGQRNLAAAVNLFNQRHNHASLNIGVGRQQAGLVYKF